MVVSVRNVDGSAWREKEGSSAVVEARVTIDDNVSVGHEGVGRPKCILPSTTTASYATPADITHVGPLITDIAIGDADIDDADTIILKGNDVVGAYKSNDGVSCDVAVTSASIVSGEPEKRGGGLHASIPAVGATATGLKVPLPRRSIMTIHTETWSVLSVPLKLVVVRGDAGVGGMDGETEGVVFKYVVSRSSTLGEVGDVGCTVMVDVMVMCVVRGWIDMSVLLATPEDNDRATDDVEFATIAGEEVID